MRVVLVNNRRVVPPSEVAFSILHWGGPAPPDVEPVEIHLSTDDLRLFGRRFRRCVKENLATDPDWYTDEPHPPLPAGDDAFVLAPASLRDHLAADSTWAREAAEVLWAGLAPPEERESPLIYLYGVSAVEDRGESATLRCTCVVLDERTLLDSVDIPLDLLHAFGVDCINLIVNATSRLVEERGLPFEQLWDDDEMLRLKHRVVSGRLQDLLGIKLRK